MNARPNTTYLRKTLLTLAVAVALCGNAAFGVSAATTGAIAFATIAHPTALRQGDAVLGALPMTQLIHIEVALKMRDRDGLDAFIANNAKNQAKSIAPQLMTPAQFLANHAPTQAQAQVVADYLTRMGYTNVVIAPNRLLVSADGTARAARDAFMTTFVQVRTRDGRIAFANTDAVRIPAALGDKVLAVVGLQTVHQASADVQHLDSNAVHTDLVMTHDPMEFGFIYGGSSAASIGIVSSGSIGPHGGLTQTISDLNTFSAYHGFTPIGSVIVNTNGTTNTPGADAPSALASQAIAGVTEGRVQQFIFYNIPRPTTANLTANLNKIVAQNDVRTVHDAFGVCESDAQADGSAAAQDAILQVAVAQGQTFVVSTGNPGGADQCGDGGNTPRWPASSQYVVAVAGTLLNASATAWSSETVYKQSGGSASAFEPMPAWQASFGVPGSTRVAADVALDASPTSGAKIWVNNALTPLGGNALAAALFAGQWASIGQNRPGFGFAGPVLYAAPAADFHDITSGTNDGGVTGVGSAAAVGYDPASGRGSVIFSKLYADSFGLGHHPPTASFSIDAVREKIGTFSDASTPTDSPIVSWSWNFGDGSQASTVANPVHKFAGFQTYNVVETVTDQVGASSATSRTVHVGSYELLADTSIEGTLPGVWAVVGAVTHHYDRNKVGIYNGRYTADLQPAAALTSLSQSSGTIFAYDQSASLNFALQILPQNTGATTVTDGLDVWLNTTSGTPIVQLAHLTNLDSTGAYVVYTFDLSAYIGQALQVQFKGDPTSAGTTTFRLDQVQLKADSR